MNWKFNEWASEQYPWGMKEAGLSTGEAGEFFRSPSSTLCFYFIYFYIFLFGLYPRQGETPGSEIKPLPQQQPSSQQWQCQILKPAGSAIYFIYLFWSLGLFCSSFPRSDYLLFHSRGRRKRTNWLTVPLVLGLHPICTDFWGRENLGQFGSGINFVPVICGHGCRTIYIILFFILFYFLLFRAAPRAYGNSQARGQIRVIAASLYHSSQQRQILNPLSQARYWTRNLIVTSRMRFHCATTETPGSYILNMPIKVLPQWTELILRRKGLW